MHMRRAQRHLLRAENPKRKIASLTTKQSLWGVTDHSPHHLKTTAFLALSLGLSLPPFCGSVLTCALGPQEWLAQSLPVVHDMSSLPGDFYFPTNLG